MSLVGFLERHLRDLRRRYANAKSSMARSEDSGSPKIGKRVEIRSPERLKLGRNVHIDSGSLLHCGGMEWCNHEGGIIIGNNVYIGPNCVLFGAGGIRIGDNVLISPNVVLTSHQHTYVSPSELIREQPILFGEIVLEDDVWIGSSATILPGVRIGKGSVVGAGGVVTKDVLPYSLAVGVPARVVKTREADQNG